MAEKAAKFAPGQLVQHRLFEYRGVVFDVDSDFQGTDEWYEQVARTRPPRDQPWYHVLVHEAQHATYVAERNLEPDTSHKPIRNPLIAHVFADFRDGRYVTHEATN